MSRRRLPRGRARTLAALALVVCSALALWAGVHRPAGAANGSTLVTDAALAAAADVRGSMRIVVTGGGGSRTPETASPLTSTWVDDDAYEGMEDNDIRGFLDGRFKWGWNQPGQVHVRIGRRDAGAKYGEYEIFRVLQRWESVTLPPAAQVARARLTLSIEEGAERALRVVLYAVRPDWDPGTGGTRGDNVSPPKPGEVWWGDIGFDSRSWGLPGAGFASEVDSAADVGAMPLADASFTPGDSTLVFDSPALARYVAAQSARGESLRFLLKVADFLEDVPGSTLTVYSSSQADDLAPSRRPRLDVEWSVPDALLARELDLHLEYGRRLVLPRLPTPGARWLALSLEQADPAAPRPVIEVRGGRAGVTGEWRRYRHPIPWTLDWVEVRLLAAENPVILGERFATEFVDTWIRTGPPGEQRVPWVFVSPTGARHEVLARYEGESRWSVSFVPDEIGPWQYHWTQRFTDRPYRSPDGRFDVVGGDAASIERQLVTLLERIDEQAVAADSLRRERLMLHFARLERAALATQTPSSFRGPSGLRLRGAIDRVRAALGGEPVPAMIPLRPDPGPEWAQPSAP